MSHGSSIAAHMECKGCQKHCLFADHRMGVGAVLTRDRLAEVAAQYKAREGDAGLYAVPVCNGVYVGETQIFEVRFVDHVDPNAGNTKFAAAKQVAASAAEPIRPIIILPLDLRIPATMRHIYEVFVNARARATAPENHNVNLWDFSFYKVHCKISGAELSALVLAVKAHINEGGTLPTENDSRWNTLFGHIFSYSIAPATMSHLLSGHVQKKSMDYYLKKHDLNLDGADVWDGRLRQPRTAAKQHPHSRKREAEMKRDAILPTTQDKADFASRFGLGKPQKKKKKVRS